MSTARYSGIVIIESLPDGEKETGKELFDELGTMLILAEYSKPGSGYFRTHHKVVGKNDLLSLLEVLRIRFEIECLTPIIHLEIHGVKDKIGIVMKSGEFIGWEELGDCFREINKITENNLILGLAVCNGANLIKSITMTKGAPFWAVIGSEDEMIIPKIPKIYSRLYRELIEGQNIDKIIYSINGDYNTKLLFIPSEKVFLGGIQKYMDIMCNPRSIETWARIDRLAIQASLSNPFNWDRNSATLLAANYILSEENKRRVFDRYADRFFMKYFPNNLDRFKEFNYEWLKTSPKIYRSL